MSFLETVKARIADYVKLGEPSTQTIILDDIEPATTCPPVGFKPNRKQRRAHSHSFRQRTRNSRYSQRSDTLTPKRLHELAHDKGIQFINHGLLHSLFGRANIWKEAA